MLSLLVVITAESELTKTESTYLAEVHRQSPKEKVSKQSTVRRRKRAHAHLRVPHLEEVLSPVTTPTDEEVAHRIKHVAGKEPQTPHTRGWTSPGDKLEVCSWRVNGEKSLGFPEQWIHEYCFE